jgi:hypothetical protein
MHWRWTLSLTIESKFKTECHWCPRDDKATFDWPRWWSPTPWRRSPTGPCSWRAWCWAKARRSRRGRSRWGTGVDFMNQFRTKSIRTNFLILELKIVELKTKYNQKTTHKYWSNNFEQKMANSVPLRSYENR